MIEVSELEGTNGPRVFRQAKSLLSCTYENNVTAEDLIIQPNNWDIPNLKELFVHHEVEAIRQIPIDHHNSCDSHYWKFDKKGTYTVKSAYWNYLLYSHIHNIGEASFSNPTPRIWTNIWDLKLPP